MAGVRANYDEGIWACGLPMVSSSVRTNLA